MSHYFENFPFFTLLFFLLFFPYIFFFFLSFPPPPSLSLSTMEQPRTPELPSSDPSASPPGPKAANGDGKREAAGARRPSPPTPEELVAHYEAQGLEPREASLRVIGELQAVLYRTVASGRGRKDRFMADTARKLDNSNARLAIVELKLDTKPGFPESFAIGLAAGATLHGLRSAVPLVLRAFAKMWDAVTAATKGHSPPP
uniref:Uncharacterized protein n=1 Tax=Anthurium amnicola TaxID=1678845 RepID=A0A1D1YXR0_9ARAE